MGCPDCDCWHAVPFRVVSVRGQVTENLPETLRGEVPKRRDILDEHEPRTECANDPSEFVPETRLLSGKAHPRSSDRDIRARETTAQDVRRRHVLIDQFHVGVLRGFTPVLLEYATTVGIDLAVPDRVPSGRPLEPEFQATDAGEE